MKKRKISLSQKVGLILFGIILALVCIELILRISGIGFLLYRKGFDKTFRDEPNVNKILCLGDSFTFGLGASKGKDYPNQLEEMLNRRQFSKRSLVINRGRPGYNSSEVLAQLDNDLKKYSPDLVILMIGMNDGHNPHLHYRALKQSNWYSKFRSWVSELRIYRLLQFIRFSIKRSGKRNLPVDDTEQEEGMTSRAKELFENNQIKEAQTLLIETANANNMWGYINLAQKYNSYGAIEHIIKKVLKTKPHDDFLHFTLVQSYLSQQKFDEAEKEFQYIVENFPDNSYIRIHLAQFYMDQKRYADAESILKDAIKAQGESLATMKKLLGCYKKQGKEENVDELIKKISLYREVTDINVSHMKRKIYDKGIRLIVMNYPDTDFLSEDTIKDTLFIDNKDVFKNIPEDKRVLLFATGNHCNDEGYRLIVDNVLDCILKNELLENKIDD